MPRKRSVITLRTKVQIIDHLDKGLKVAQVAKLYSMSESTIKSIKKNEQAIKKSVDGGNLYLSRTSIVRDELIEKTEKALIIWIEDQAQKGIPIGINDIRDKSLKIYGSFKEQSSTDAVKKSSFSASRGWFEKFKHRYSLYNLTTKSKGISPCADTQSTQAFIRKFLELVDQECYTPHQVFNADECFLAWKKISINKNVLESIKFPKEYIKILLCSNASGDNMMKPLVVHKSENPRSFRNIDVKNLPVYWMANENVWMTASMFTEWFFNIFVPDVRQYLLSKNLPPKALLLLSEGQNHPQDLQDENIRVVFFPKNTHTILQPLDQGIMSNFKMQYFKNTQDFILYHNETCDSVAIMNALRNFTILDCINQVALSCCMDKTLLNKCWQKLWSPVVETGDDSKVFNHEVEQKSIGDIKFSKTGKDRVVADSQDLNDSDVMDFVNVELNETVNMIGEENNVKHSNWNRTFNKDDIKLGLDLGEKLINYFVERDPNKERAANFQNSLNKSLNNYKKLYKEIKKRCSET